MKMIGWLLLLSLPLNAQGFDLTRWGMSEEDVQACYPNRTWYPTCSDGTRSISQINLEQDFDGVRVKVEFYFRNNRLDNVEIFPAGDRRLKPGAQEAAGRLLEALVRRHGPPRDHQGFAQGTEGFRWLLPGTEVRASQTVSATECLFHIQYLPGPPQR